MDTTQIVLITLLSVGIAGAVVSLFVRSLDYTAEKLWIELIAIIVFALFIYLIGRP